MWVQVWGLPFDLISEEASRDIGSGLGRVIEIDNKAFSSEQARFVRVRVEIPLDKPLRRSGVVANPEGDTVRIGFKYERLVGLCYQCGILGHEAKECSHPRDKTQREIPYGEWLKAGFRGPVHNSEGRSKRPTHRDKGDDGVNGGRVPSSPTKTPFSDSVITPAGTEITAGYVTNHSLHGAKLMARSSHEANNAGTDHSISGFAATQKETDALNHGGDVSMEIPETAVELMGHQCATDKLISVPVKYVAVEVEQQPILEQAREAARETLNTQIGKTWKRAARDPHISTHATYMSSDAVGSKRSFQEAITDQDEVLVEVDNKNRKRGKLVEDKHDNEYTTAEADDQPRRAQ